MESGYIEYGLYFEILFFSLHPELSERLLKKFMNSHFLMNKVTLSKH